MTRHQQPQISDWTRKWFKTNKVWLAIDPLGKPVTQEGKVLIKYQLKQDYQYWVNPNNVRPLDSPPPKSKSGRSAKPNGKKPVHDSAGGSLQNLDESDCEGKICIYTDGAASGNPGPAGIGVLLRFGQHEKEISKFIGNATNNVAELIAIRTGLSAVKATSKPVRLFTDSQYAYGLLVLNWKAHKNQQIVTTIKKLMTNFKDLAIIKVKGHAGHEGNEKADALATTAIKKARGTASR